MNKSDPAIITRARRQYAQIERAYMQGKNIDNGAQRLNKTMETIRRADINAYYQLADTMLMNVRYALYSGVCAYTGRV